MKLLIELDVERKRATKGDVDNLLECSFCADLGIVPEVGATYYELRAPQETAQVFIACPGCMDGFKKAQEGRKK